MKKFLLITFVSLACAGLATAAITPAILGTPTVDGSDFQWNYQISVDNQEELLAASSTPCTTAAACGSFFTIYDFEGYVAGSITAPAGWTTQVSLVGLTNPNQNPTDSGTVDNLTFIYTGSPSTVPGPISDLTGFSAVSTFGQVNNGGTFTYQAAKLDGQVDAGIGSINVPLSPTPEPATTGLIALGLAGIALARRKFAR
jgi:hypothetical protein